MKKIFNKIFVTVGTTRFDALCEHITSPTTLQILKVMGCRELTVQVGNSDIEPKQFILNDIKIDIYRFKDSIIKDIQSADLVISHAGAGSCLETLDEKKPLLVVVNEDLMDNHQLELAEQLQVDGHLYYCTCDTLESTLQEVDFSLLIPYCKPNPSLFLKYLDDYFQIKKVS